MYSLHASWGYYTVWDASGDYTLPPPSSITYSAVPSSLVLLFFCTPTPLQSHFLRSQGFQDHLCSKFHSLKSSRSILPFPHRMGILDTFQPAGARLGGLVIAWMALFFKSGNWASGRQKPWRIPPGSPFLCAVFSTKGCISGLSLGIYIKLSSLDSQPFTSTEETLEMSWLPTLPNTEAAILGTPESLTMVMITVRANASSSNPQET